ncbi:type II toxin-antitoxin system PemK/MazF family toxin [Ligilactobacillus equi]|uniref:type II toxin-antitoxin system PemK/MazF family toxin n=1 Tax=Ligilactobacillus equi TaxID=137357 RepID=UPI002ED465DF
MESMGIYIANVPFDDVNDSKVRPALVIKVGQEQVTVFRVTSQYQKKSVQIEQEYYPIQEWEEAGLKKKPYVDTHKLYRLSREKIFSRKPIGKLTSFDQMGLFDFIKNKTNY